MTLNINGATDAEIAARTSLTGSINGATDVLYRGSTVDVAVNGAADLSQGVQIFQQPMNSSSLTPK